jgi:hypothetical protein
LGQDSKGVSGLNFAILNIWHTIVFFCPMFGLWLYDPRNPYLYETLLTTLLVKMSSKLFDYQPNRPNGLDLEFKRISSKKRAYK